MFRWILNLFIIAALAVIQTSFFSVLPFFQYFNPVLLYIIYASVKKGSFLPIAFLGGYILDLYSSYPFGLHIAALVFAAIFTNYLYTNVITSRRFFTLLILAAASIMLYHAFLLLGIIVLLFLKLSPQSGTTENFDLHGIGIEIISVSIASGAAYFAYYFIRKKLSSRLMLKKYAPR